MGVGQHREALFVALDSLAVWRITSSETGVAFLQRSEDGSDPVGIAFATRLTEADTQALAAWLRNPAGDCRRSGLTAKIQGGRFLILFHQFGVAVGWTVEKASVAADLLLRPEVSTGTHPAVGAPFHHPLRVQLYPERAPNAPRVLLTIASTPGARAFVQSNADLECLSLFTDLETPPSVWFLVRRGSHALLFDIRADALAHAAQIAQEREHESVDVVLALDNGTSSLVQMELPVTSAEFLAATAFSRITRG